MRFFSHLLTGFFFYWAVSGAVVTARENPSTESYIGLLSVGLHMLLGLVTWIIAGLLYAQPNSMLAWHTPVTGPILYRRLLQTRYVSLIWVFLLVPAAAMVPAATATKMLFPSALLGVLGYLAMFAATYGAVTQGLRWYHVLVNPTLILITAFTTMIPMKWWKGAAATLFFVTVTSGLALDYLDRNPFPSIDLFILSVSASLHRVPILGPAASYLWCPFLELAQLFSNARTTLSVIASIGILQLLLIGLQFPLLRETLTENEPLWRTTDELSDFASIADGDNFSTADGPEGVVDLKSTSSKIPPQHLAASQRSIAKAKDGKWTFLVIYAFMSLNFIIPGLDQPVPKTYTALGIFSVAFWALLANLFRLPLNLTNAWWPIDRLTVLRKSIIGKWWELPLIIILMISFTTHGTLAAEHLLWLLPGFFVIRAGLAVAIIYGAHRQLGRGLSAWIRHGAWALSLAGISLFLMHYAIYGWDLSMFAMRLRILLGIAASLLPVLGAAAFTIWYEHRHTGRQYYTLLR